MKSHLYFAAAKHIKDKEGVTGRKEKKLNDFNVKKEEIRANITNTLSSKSKLNQLIHIFFMLHLLKKKKIHICTSKIHIRKIA